MILVIYKEELSYQKNREELFFLLKHYDTNNDYLFLSIDEIINNIDFDNVDNLDKIIQKYKSDYEIKHIFLYPRQAKIIDNHKFYELLTNYPVKKTIFIDDLHHWEYNFEIINKFDNKLLPYHYLANKLMPQLSSNGIINFPHYLNDKFVKEPSNNRNIQLSVLGHFKRSPYLTRKQLIEKTHLVNPRLEFCKLTPFSEELENSQYYEILANSYASVATTLDRKQLYYPYIVSKYFEIPGCGALLIAHVLPEMEEEMSRLGFIDNENYIKFRDINDFVSKCNYVFNPKNKEIIEKIRIKGFELVKNNHLLSNRIKELLKVFQQS